MRIFRYSVLIVAAMAAALTAPAKTLTPVGPVTAPLSVDTKTAVPGHTLKPGSYSIHVVDHLPDRCILRVEDARGHAVATFIGLLNAGYIGADGLGAVPWAKGPDKTPALRGFSFANGLTVEFVYPKNEAVALAQLNASSVPAIDPESEGRPSDAKLSDEDRQVVTLWTLTSKRVGPGEGLPAIEAKRYQAEPNTELAENSVPPPPSAHSAATAPPPALPVPKAVPNDAGGVQPARRSNRVKNNVTAERLPQTASDLPFLMLLSGMFLFAGISVGARRRFVAGRQISRS